MSRAITITLPARSRVVRLPAEAAPADAWLTQAEAARYLGVHPKTLSNWTNRDDDPVPAHYLTAREPRYRRSELDAWMLARPGRGAA